jgi:hypothetical protein
MISYSVIHLSKIIERKVYGPQSLKLNKTGTEANWGEPNICRRPIYKCSLALNLVCNPKVFVVCRWLRVQKFQEFFLPNV